MQGDHLGWNAAKDLDPRKMRPKAHRGKTDEKQAKVYEKEVKGPMKGPQGAEQEGHEMLKCPTQPLRP